MVACRYYLLAVAALPSLAASSPIDLKKRGTFSVEQQANANFSGKNGSLALAKAYRKYGVAPPPQMAIAVAGLTGEVTASPTLWDREYLCPVSIGGQMLNLDFDSGSADL
jgi:hypothetical protein